jgi:hypothetical protein
MGEIPYSSFPLHAKRGPDPEERVRSKDVADKDVAESDSSEAFSPGGEPVKQNGRAK